MDLRGKSCKITWLEKFIWGRVKIMLEVQKIDVFYGEIQILKEVSLRVNNGEFVVLLGPNGHGKSTLLKTICGLHPVESGNINFCGSSIIGLSPQKIVASGLIYVAEDRHLFPEMTVMENLKLGAYNFRARDKIDESFDFVFQLFPRLGERKKQLASTLSGGESQMLALGRGIMSCAKFMAIDEPSLGLSPLLRADVFEKITLINKNGIGILLVEQNIERVAAFSDRVYLMEDGKIVFAGTADDALKNKHLKEVLLGIS